MYYKEHEIGRKDIERFCLLLKKMADWYMIKIQEPSNMRGQEPNLWFIYSKFQFLTMYKEQNFPSHVVHVMV